MPTKRCKTFSSRRTAVQRVWRNFRLRWTMANKHILVIVVAAAGVMVGFGVVLESVYAAKVEQQNVACLARNIYYEARGEPRAGQYAVAEVTMNRVNSSRYPSTVCGVVYQQNWDVLRKRYVGAFSWTEFDAVPEPRGKQWERAQRIAEEVYHQRKEPKLADALHYHADYIRPSWSRKQTPIARIGNHIFYR